MVTEEERIREIKRINEQEDNRKVFITSM